MARRLPLAVLVLAFARLAHATFPYPAPPPGTPPQAYASYLRLPVTVPPTRPSDFAGGDAWKLTSDQSGNPTIDANPAELFGVTGMSVDKAWQVSTGRPDVLIAVLDSGIRWDDAGAMGAIPIRTTSTTTASSPPPTTRTTRASATATPTA
jgi:hypothetical protein